MKLNTAKYEDQIKDLLIKPCKTTLLIATMQQCPLLTFAALSRDELCEVVNKMDVSLIYFFTPTTYAVWNFVCHTFEDCRSEQGSSGGCYRRG